MWWVQGDLPCICLKWAIIFKKRYFIVWRDFNLFMHLSVEGHLDCFKFFTITRNAAQDFTGPVPRCIGIWVLVEFSILSHWSICLFLQHYHQGLNCYILFFSCLEKTWLFLSLFSTIQILESACPFLWEHCLD